MCGVPTFAYGLLLGLCVRGEGSAYAVCSRPTGFGQQGFALLHQLKDLLELDGTPLQADHLIFVLHVHKSCESLLLPCGQEVHERAELG